jgi:hypothetical protein
LAAVVQDRDRTTNAQPQPQEAPRQGAPPVYLGDVGSLADGKVGETQEGCIKLVQWGRRTLNGTWWGILARIPLQGLPERAWLQSDQPRSNRTNCMLNCPLPWVWLRKSVA